MVYDIIDVYSKRGNAGASPDKNCFAILVDGYRNCSGFLLQKRAYYTNYIQVIYLKSVGKMV